MKLHQTVKTLATNKELRQYAMKKPVVFFGERMTFGQSLGCFGYMVAIMLIALVALVIAANLLIQKRSKAQSQSNNAQTQTYNRHNERNPTVFIMKL